MENQTGKTEVVAVRFKTGGKNYYFDPGELTLKKDMSVIVETARGLECGIVATGNTLIPDEQVVKPLKGVIRIATDDDLQRVEKNAEKEKEAFRICEEKIEKLGLVMNLTDVEYTFDGSKIIFYFTADGRVDFRELVKELASTFRTRIELRQIGVRDEARMIGGIGICGKEFCCTGFLPDFQPVSIKMAKDQGLSLNPVKISGSCGRLMCCLKYEQDVYEELLKITPYVGSYVKTPEGNGTVTDSSILKGKVKVSLDRNPEGLPQEFSVSEVHILKKAARKHDENEENLKGLE